MYVVYFILGGIVVLLIVVVGITPLLAVPVALFIAIALAWPAVFGAARKMGTPPAGGARGDRPSTREASHDPAAGPPR